MDSSIIKLLEEDEDETMHSGADVEALTAVLNRDIKGGVATSQPAHSASSQDNNQTSSQTYSQWQPSSEEQNNGNQPHQQCLSSQEQQQSSEGEMKEHESSKENPQKVNVSQAPRGSLPQLQRSVQIDGQGQPAEPYSGEFPQPSMLMQPQISGLNHVQVHERNRVHNPSNESQLSNMQRSGNRPVSVPEQSVAPANQGNHVSFATLLKIIECQLDNDKAMQLRKLYEKLKKNEIPRDGFVRLMKGIVGGQLLNWAVLKLQAKSHNFNQQRRLRPPTGTAPQVSDPYSFGQLHQKNLSTSTMTRPPASKMHRYDTQARQGHQGFGSAHGDSTSEAMNVMNTPKVEKQNVFNDTKRIPGVAIANMPTPIQHGSVPWQVSKEQENGASSNMSYVKQEPFEQALDKKSKPQISSAQGPSFPVAVESLPIPSSNDEVLETHNFGNSLPSKRTATVATSTSVSSHMDTDIQSISTTAFGGIGNNSKASSKKTSTGQKKPLDAIASSPPLPSKKQKVSGIFSDQSIEHLNDVTAVSGVDLRVCCLFPEEEEQLFSGPKDENRVSEASRKAVKEEEDRLILQKVPLQKKLVKIMANYGLKNLSNDVERCLSLCVEERMRGLISSLIEVSKQRVDSEKSRHNIVVTSDVREQILAINQKFRELEKKQTEAEKVQKQNEQPESSAVVDVDKEKDERRAKSQKVNKEEDEKMRFTATNLAARAAFGGDDMLSKWQLMAQARQKREEGPEIASSSQASKDASNRQVANSAGSAKGTQGTGKNPSAGRPAYVSGGARQSGRIQVPRVAPCITVKDVITVLEREPQMAKSSIIYKLYNRVHADPTTVKIS
ncbi:transcription initiation factor TFIID subunit 4b-like isoform X3 [Amaranthus tricolor]|uniref:transcription initiation factor TFIID subunit 4b-like isoform X3 n=1 Tax=Amaranthus tricolor TaxID=29722 RepID=UPI0025855884|nr:transcription initiation factor TFIID subunit 4b-like isoform X3 [Amaranthus tricolor]